VVESQHQVSTRKLVDSADEQLLLEQLIDGAKPPDRTGGRLHYLLFTPFRYPPLAHGSRFGRRHDRGIWYGSLERRSAFAEVAYYRLLFIEGTRAELGTITTPLTAFRAALHTRRGAALEAPPFSAFRAAIASPTSYAETQPLGEAMRAAGGEAFTYPSARDVEGGVNVGAVLPTVFSRARPASLESWHCAASRTQVDVTRTDYVRRETFTFPREQFLVDGTLPAPAI
jgi:hypothetical protein